MVPTTPASSQFVMLALYIEEFVILLLGKMARWQTMSEMDLESFG